MEAFSLFKSRKNSNIPNKFTLGEKKSEDEFEMYWVSGGEVKIFRINKNALHKLF